MICMIYDIYYKYENRCFYGNISNKHPQTLVLQRFKDYQSEKSIGNVGNLATKTLNPKEVDYYDKYKRDRNI